MLNLPHGCRDTDPETGELLVRGRRGKGIRPHRLPVFLERTRARGCLPGRPDGHGGTAVNFGHILRQCGRAARRQVSIDDIGMLPAGQAAAEALYRLVDAAYVPAGRVR